MINPFTSRNVNILNNISLNVRRNSDVSQKNELEKYNPKVQIEKYIKEKEENISTSSRSSQSELSDVVKLNDTTDIENIEIKSNHTSTLESKPVIALFIGDLDKGITEDMLKKIFGKFKTLVSVKICVDSETGKSLGYGYLNFSTKEDADTATEEFNYRPILGKEIRIMPSLRNTFYRKNMGTNVFFSNLPLEDPTLTTRVFYDIFKIYGKILSCKLDKRKNIGFVYFDNDQAARKVIKNYNAKDFFGNKILCGIHFDKDFRKYPEFEKRKSTLDEITIQKEELTSAASDRIIVEHNSGSQIPHPNAVFVKNLPMDSTDEEILDFFSTVGPVKSVFSSKAIKFKSLWAFVTYKRGLDTKKAIEYYNDRIFKQRHLIVTKAEPKEGFNSTSSNYENYKTVIYLNNVSSVCNEEFLSQMCIQERIRINRLQITSYDEDSLTYSGYVKCRTKNDAVRLFESLNNRLIGGCVVKASWRKIEKSTSAFKSKFDSHRQLNNLDHSEILSLSPSHTYYYPSHSGPNSLNPAIQSLSETKEQYNYKRNQQKKQVLEYLKRQVRKGIDFLRYPSATRDENLTCITEYIFDVYWRGEINNLTKFMLLMNTNTQNEGILHRQIEEAANFLGFER